MTSCPITCAVCAYKESPYIEECIKSLLQQTVRPVIFISTSTPNPFIKNLAHKYHVPLYVNPGKGDMQDNWNFAYQTANTPYVTICHQDDVYEPTYVEELLKPIETDKKNDIILLHTGWRMLKNKVVKPSACSRIHRFLNKLGQLTPTKRWVRCKLLAVGNCIKTPSICYHKTHCPSPLFTSTYQFNVDWDTFLTLAHRPGRFVYMDKPLFLYRVSNEAHSYQDTRNRVRAREDLYIFSSLWPRPVAWLIAQIYKLAYRVYD